MCCSKLRKTSWAPFLGIFVLMTVAAGPMASALPMITNANLPTVKMEITAHGLLPRGGPSAISLGTAPVWNSTDPGWPSAVVLGDLDSDGDLDLIVGTASGDSLRAYTTTKGIPSSTPTWNSNEKPDTSALAMGDYDQDGDLDLAVGNDGGLEPQKNTLYRNDNGTLTSNAVWTSDEKDPTAAICWGDIDLDGDLDLVVGNRGKIRLHRNDEGVLTNGSVWNSSATYGLKSMALADFDKDGDLDLALANGYGPNPNVIIRNKNGAFEDFAFWNSTEADSSKQIAWVDYDSDGDLDLSVGNEETAALRLYKNVNGVIGKTAVWNGTMPMPLWSMVWGDFDNDGDQDLAAGGYDHNVTIFRNDLGTLTGYPVWNSTLWDKVAGMASGDIDMDGDIDLVIATMSLNRLFKNTYNAFFTKTLWTSSESESPYTMDLADYDEDGDLDLAMGFSDFSTPNRVYRNDNGVLSSSYSWQAPTSELTAAIAWADYDGDGDLDLSVGNGGASSSGPLRIYRNNNGALTNYAVWNSTNNEYSTALSWGDYDNDGDLDLVTGNSGFWGAQNRLYKNDKGIMRSLPSWNSTETDKTYAVAWGDIDNDGDLDLASGNQGSVKIHRNDGGNLSLKATWTSAESENTEAIFWGDYDNDGDLDLATGTYMGKNRIYRNDGGALKAEAAWTSAEADSTKSVIWVDMDLDGDLDLVAGNWNNPVRVYRNTYGEIETVSAWNATEALYGNTLVAGDIDKDGDPDLVLDSNLGQTVAFENKMGAQSNNNPIVTLPPLRGKFKGDVRINYTLIDPESDNTAIAPYYSAGNGKTWYLATGAPSSEGTKLLAASPAGKQHQFIWDSNADRINSTKVIFKIYVMDLPKVGVYQKISHSKMTSTISVTNYWPQYLGGLVSEIVNEDTNWSRNLDAYFKDSDDDSSHLTYKVDHDGADLLHPKITIDPLTHVASWTPVHGDQNLKNVLFRALDPQGHVGASVPMILFYNEVNEPPLFGGTLNASLRLHDTEVPEDSRWSVDLDDYFWDEEKDAGIIFTSNSSFVHVDPVTHIASYEPVHGDSSVLGLVFTARDADDAMMTVSSNPMNLTYVEVNDQWPVYIGGLGDTLVYEDTIWAVDLDTVFFDEESNPQLFDGSLSFSCSHSEISINGSSHIASWKPGHGNATLYSVAFMAHDPLRPWRNASSPPITLIYVEVNDQQPQFLGGLPKETFVDEDTIWMVNLGNYFQDEESGSALVYRSDSPQVLIEPIINIASWRPVHGSKDTVVNLTAVDPLNLNWSATHTLVLRYREVNDQAPVFVGGLQGAVVPEDTIWSTDLDDFFADEEKAPLAFTTSHEAVFINGTTHVASWTPRHGSGSLVAVRFMATDGKFTTETSPITLTYQEINDQAPVYLGGLKNASKGQERIWKVDLDNYFTDEENPDTLIFTCNKKDVKIDPITHEATWSPKDDKTFQIKKVVFRAYDPEQKNQTVVSESLTLKVPEVITDTVLTIGPIELGILDVIGYGFSGLSIIAGAYYSTKKIRLTNTHKKSIKKIKNLAELKAYYSKKIRPDIEEENVTPVQGILLKDAVEERSIKIRRRSGKEVDLDEDAKTTPSSEDLERIDEDKEGTALPDETKDGAIPDDKEVGSEGSEEE